MSILVKLLLIVGLSCGASFGDIVHDEAVDGDLSDNHLVPSQLVLNSGSNEIIGSTTANPFDRDFWTVEVPSGLLLDSIVLKNYDVSSPDQSFFAVAHGTEIPTLFDPNILLGNTLIGQADGRQEGDDVLDDLGEAFYGGIGFTGPLGPGTYTFWYQETGTDTGYSLEFNISAVPEPAITVPLVVSALTILLRRRRDRIQSETGD